MTEPKRLSTGYYRIQLGPMCFAQWPVGEELRREHIFQPSWNEPRVMEWYRKWRRQS